MSNGMVNTLQNLVFKNVIVFLKSFSVFAIEAVKIALFTSGSGIKTATNGLVS